MGTLLITGTQSGIGRYLHEELGGSVYTRETSDEELEKIRSEGVEAIIHCAAKPRDPKLEGSDRTPYIPDNVDLTEKICAIPHKQFIYFSTVDVYPKSDERHTEDEVIALADIGEPYAETKLIGEEIVRKKAHNPIIFRCVNILGKYARKTNVMKLIEDDNPQLTLTADSEINVVTYDDIRACIEYARTHNMQGTYNIARSAPIQFGKIAEMVGKKVQFGTYTYHSGNIDNTKITALLPQFKETAEGAVRTCI